MIKTTKRQFKLFCDEFRRQVVHMGLMEWELRFFLEDIGPNLASMATDSGNRCCAVRLTQSWQDPLPLNDDQLKECAKHEVLHLLIDDIASLVRSPFVTADELDVTEHTLVRRLEKLL